MRNHPILFALSPLALVPASCSAAPAGESAQGTAAGSATTLVTTPPASPQRLALKEIARFNEPWAIAFIPGTPYALVTEKKGTLKLWQEGGAVRDVKGVPAVAYAGQGGLGDVILAPDFSTSGIVYLSWAEQGRGATRGAAVGRARLVMGDAPRLENLAVIWRQDPKVTGEGHYSHRLAFSRDGKYLFVASGERQKMTPAQDMATNLGKIVRLLPDGTPAPGNPMGTGKGVTRQIWTSGHRNILGLKFDAQGRLWDLEHGAEGGDELNLVTPGSNYGWPLVSEGGHYDGRPIPHHSTRPEFTAPAIAWNPVIAPGDFIFYRGDAFPEWKGQAIVAAMKPAAVVRVAIEGGKAREVARYPTEHRIRSIAEREDGSIWLLEDGKEAEGGRLLRIEPPRP